MGAPGVLASPDVDIVPMLIAVREFQAGTIPLTVRRFPNGRD